MYEKRYDKLETLCISPECSILEAIKVLDETHERIVLIVEDRKLLGVLTDSDVRKLILKSQDMTETVTAAMTKKPVCVTEEDAHRAVSLMERYGIDAIPVIDRSGMLLDLLFRYETPGRKRRCEEKTQAPVVIMAGGKGTRLYPYTQVLPKPLIPIGKTTILEQVIDSFREAGCSRFYLSVNYRKNLIKAYMQDLHPAYAVTYLEEEDFLGTAGSLYLVKEEIQEPFFVSNCDILLDVDYGKVMKFHRSHGNVITLITSLKNYTIPYGVVNIGRGGQMESLSEKPEMSFLVNTGVYVLDPQVLQLIPKEGFMHITDLIQVCLDRGEHVGVYPITEKAWEDMGEFSSMEEMLRTREIREQSDR
ncbi:nucleotidyltransferase family protein [Lachnospiraceae bacterium JLR.KK008]